MKEDLEIIEDNIDMFMDTLYENYRQSTVKSFEKAIKNLIAGYKNLEEKNKDLTWYFENQKENYIPKSKVKEIIQEKNINLNGFEYIATDDLQELIKQNENHISYID